MVIILISFAGEILHAFLPLPVPASIYGMILMLLLLQTGILPLEDIKETGLFLVEIMPVLFIPAGVGLMDSFGELREILLPVTVIIAAVTFIVMAVAGHTAQFIIRRRKKKGEQ